MQLPIKGGINHFVWKQHERGELALAFWHATWPGELRPPLSRTLRLRVPGYAHPIRIDTLSGAHPDFPPNRVENDSTMFWDEVPIPDYPIVAKLFKVEKR